MKKNIAIIGATGIVGRTAIKIIEERGLDKNNFFLFATEKSRGKIIKIHRKKYIVQVLEEAVLQDLKIDFALFCTKENVSKKYVPQFIRNGAKVIDFSSYYRKKYPLIIPEINREKAIGSLICNPNCSTSAGVMALYEIHRQLEIKEIIYSTYQAVSGAGKVALDDLREKNSAKLKLFKFPIYDNLIPQIGEIDERGFSTEENKMIYETRKILGDRKIKISATCVRIPISTCHSLSIHFKTRQDSSLEEIKNILRKTKGVIVADDPPYFPMPVITKGQNNIFVGRIRESYEKNSFDIFVCSDNLRKGAAQNGVQILELLLSQK